MASSILKVRVLGVEKRLTPKVQFVYVLGVEWSSGAKHLIVRSFKDIYKFHVRLSQATCVLDDFFLRTALVGAGDVARTKQRALTHARR
jgi:hypothetical protein